MGWARRDLRSLRLPCAAVIVALVTVTNGYAPAQAQERSVTLVAADKTRVKVTQDTPVLPSEIDAKSVRVLINGGPVSLCEKQSYGNVCMIISNNKIACDLDACFAGAGDWRNRIRSVKFL